MHLYTNKINDLRNQEKEPTRKMRNSLLPPRCRLAVARQSLLRKRRKNFFIHLCAKEWNSANGCTRLAQRGRPAYGVERTTRYNARPHCINAKKPPGTNRAFRIRIFISESRFERRGSKSKRPLRAMSCMNQAGKYTRYKDRGFCSPPINRTLILTEAISPL